MRTRNISETVINIVLLVAGITLLVSAQSIKTGAVMGQGGDFMPKLCAGIWTVLSFIMLVSGWFAKTEQAKQVVFNYKGFFATLVLLFGYVALLKPVGFVITSVLYMFIQMCLFVPKDLMSKKRLILFGIISLVLPVAVNLLFANAFSLILPTGILG